MTHSNSTAARVAFLVSDLGRDRNQLSVLKELLTAWIPASNEEIREIIERLAALDPSSSSVQLGAETALHSLAQFLGRSETAAAANIDTALPALQDWYHQTPPESALRNYILSLLTQSGTPESLALFVSLCIDDPPRHVASLSLSFGPLISKSVRHWESVFPRLLDGLQHADLAAAILDVANHAYTERRVSEHPAGPRAAALRELLRGFSDRMEAWQETRPSQKTPEDLRKRISETVAVVVSLCRSLGLIRDSQAAEVLRRIATIKHRRIQAEAAGALALLGDPFGVQTLVELARSPVSRLRAIAYADEVGALDQIEPQFRTAVARAEGELAAWLAEPTQFGIAPGHMELIDQRELYWPGFSDLQDCYLFRFAYPTASGAWSNIGITGPVTHATSHSLESLSVKQIYSLFAGWQTVHDEIYEIEWQHLAARQKESVVQTQQKLLDEGYGDVEPVFVGRFFGDEFTVATARRDNQLGHVVWNSQQVWWLPDPRQQINVELAYCLFKGQKLLAHFNPDFADVGDEGS
jgi:hypothetical protein